VYIESGPVPTRYTGEVPEKVGSSSQVRLSHISSKKIKEKLGLNETRMAMPGAVQPHRIDQMVSSCWN
jgi:hypothetical protein